MRAEAWKNWRLELSEMLKEPLGVRVRLEKEVSPDKLRGEYEKIESKISELKGEIKDLENRLSVLDKYKTRVEKGNRLNKEQLLASLDIYREALNSRISGKKDIVQETEFVFHLLSFLETEKRRVLDEW